MARSTGTNSPRMKTRPSSGNFDSSALYRMCNRRCNTWNNTGGSTLLWWLAQKTTARSDVQMLAPAHHRLDAGQPQRQPHTAVSEDVEHAGPLEQLCQQQSWRRRNQHVHRDGDKGRRRADRRYGGLQRAWNAGSDSSSDIEGGFYRPSAFSPQNPLEGTEGQTTGRPKNTNGSTRCGGSSRRVHVRASVRTRGEASTRWRERPPVAHPPSSALASPWGSRRGARPCAPWWRSTSRAPDPRGPPRPATSRG